MSRTEARDGARCVLSLRTALLATAIACAVYAAASLATVVNLSPGLRRLGVQTVSATAAVGPVQRLDSALGASVHDVWLLMETSLRGRARPDIGGSREILTRVRAYSDSAWALQASYRLGPVSPEARLAVSRAMTAESQAVVHLFDAIAAYELGWTEQAAASLREAEDYRGIAMQRLREAEGHTYRELAAREEALRASGRALLRAIGVIGLVGVVLLVLTGILLYRRLHRPLLALSRALERISGGDLEVQLPVDRCDELGRIQQRFNEVLQALRNRSEDEKKKARNLTERLARTLDSSSDEIYIFDAKSWRFMYANRGATENLGYTQQELAELTPLDVLPEFDRRRFAGMIAPLKSGSQTRIALSTVHRRVDGSQYPVELSVQLSHSEEPPVFHAIAQDMSERARLEHERDEMFDLSPDLLATGTFQGNLTRVNAAWGRLLGFTEKELLSKPFLSFVHPDDVPIARGQLLGMRDGRTRVQGTSIRMRCRDGSFRWISWNVDSPEGANTIYAVGRDVTERRRAQQRQTELLATIARSAREWKVTFDALDDPVLVVDRKGQVTRANDAARRLAAMTHPELLQLRIDELPPKQLWHQAAMTVESAFTKGTSVSAQARSKSDGRVWDIEVSPVPIEDRERGAAIVIAHDVTRVIELQDVVRRNEAMAATGALVAGVAHEVRNPLFSMSATLDAFEARQGREQSSQRHIQVLRSQLDRLRQLMQELLEYGKPPQLNLAATPFEHVARQAIEETASLAEERSVRVVTDMAEGLPLIRADRARLVQVYVNLLSNAIQHAPQRGEVVLRAREVNDNGVTWLETSVEDNGEGFKPDDLPRVFEPFFTRRRGGTGLGLALVQRIVEQHGGRAVANNRKSGGAVVSVHVPVFDVGRVSGPRVVLNREAPRYAS